MRTTEYFPTLCTRPAEMRALKELPGATKDRLTPVLLLAPWTTALELSAGLVKFGEVFGPRPYFVDVDMYYRPPDAPRPAVEDWRALSEPPADLDLWHRLLEPHPNAAPCLLMNGHDIEAVRRQVEWARGAGRPFGLRLHLAVEGGSGIPSWFPVFVEELAEHGGADYAVILEFGWHDDPLTHLAIASGLIRTTLGPLGPRVPIVVSTTNFPVGFSNIDGTAVVSFSNRELLAQLRRATNYPLIVYGDWGSTRPRRSNDGRTPKNRLDYPLDDRWLFRRDQATSIDLAAAARDVVADRHWTGNLGVWGEQQIEAAAQGDPFALKTMPRMYSCRINIHLHRQAFFGDDFAGLDLDDDWSDDL